MTKWFGLVALAALLVGLGLVLVGRKLRRPFGLGQGQTVALDDVTLTSRRLGLTGLPDRLVRADGTVIPEEWKSSRRVHDSHRAQMAVYFVLIEDQLGVRPPHGFVVLGDGSRHRIENTDGLRNWVLEVAERIRAARVRIEESIAVDPTPGQCRACGIRDHCGQRRS